MKHVVLQDPARSSVSEIAIAALPGVSLLTLGAVHEPLALVAHAFPRALPRLTIAGDGWGAMARETGAESDMPLTLTALAERLEHGPRPDTLILCGGPPVSGAVDATLGRLIRIAGRWRIHLICIGGASFTAARSGLLRGAAAIHWRVADAFAERHPDIEASDALFLSGGCVDSCVGGAAALDMIIAFIGKRFSPKIAHAVRAHLAAPTPRLGSEHQPGSPRIVARRLPKPLGAIVERMRSTIDSPVPIGELCQEAEISQRQIERLFRHHLRASPVEYYRALQLDRARQLVEHTGLNLREVAVACGFGTFSTFTRYYQRRFGHTPAAARKDAALAAALT